MREISTLSGTPSAIARKRSSRSCSSTCAALRSLMSVTVTSIASWPPIMMARADRIAHMVSAVGPAQFHLEAIDPAILEQPLDQALAIAQIQIGGADGIALVPDAQAENLVCELVGEQDFRLADARDHDRQRDAVRHRLQELLAFLELVVRRLLRRHIAGQQHPAAAWNRAFAHAYPAAVGDAELPILARRATVEEPALDEVGAHVGMVHAAGRARLAYHVLEPGAQLEHRAKCRRRVFGIAAVEVDQAVVGVVDGEPVHERFGGGQEAILTRPGVPLGRPGRIARRAQLGGAVGDPALQQLVRPLQRLLGRPSLGHVLEGADQ